MKKNVLFVINPISGGKSKQNLPELLDRYLDKDKFEATYSFSEKVKHAAELTHEALRHDFDIIVAVGGDGTINEVASAVVGTDKAVGIIPSGSGNGLARFLGISMDHKKAMETINKFSVDQIDTAVMNGKKFFNMAGMGFDAHISAVFASATQRGLVGYAKTAFSEIKKYQPQDYQITIDGNTIERNAFMLSIANSSQYGNNAHISPKASIRDGLLDVCVIKPFPIALLPLMGLTMFSGRADQSKYVEIIRGKHIIIERENEMDDVHLDGEPRIMGKVIDIEVKPLSLNIID